MSLSAQEQSPVADDDDDNTCIILAGALGGAALFGVVALATYLLVIKKAKPGTVFPEGHNGEVTNTRFEPSSGQEQQS